MNESELGRLHSVFLFERHWLVGAASWIVVIYLTLRQNYPYDPEGIYRILRQTYKGTSE